MNRAPPSLTERRRPDLISAKIAGIKAAEANLDVRRAVMASDAFFPFRDGIDAAAKDGICAVIQPGGSMRDKEVIVHGPIGLAEAVMEQGRRGITIQRYKGLGEMNAEQLADTTMNPDKRTLLVVRLEDLVATDLIFTTLMGEDVESRRKFIEENALDVKNLDI